MTTLEILSRDWAVGRHSLTPDDILYMESCYVRQGKTQDTRKSPAGSTLIYRSTSLTTRLLEKVWRNAA
ncbi:MAG TPA: hypothetical protein VNL17_14265 [Verrucomicrobiae bacterium]|nr:hypothetical protein [Verrucomicrobiae bacterium]